MHFMLLEHDLPKLPGRYRTRDAYVQDEREGRTVYTGPDAAGVPLLMAALAEELDRASPEDPMVKAAMAHLHLVMILPFKDGNGRMARALQTLVLAQDRVLEPTFSSIEEWLGHNTEDYYRALGVTGGGSWQPNRDSSLWVKFSLRAHHMQAQTLRRRFSEAETLWALVENAVAHHGLPDRAGDPLFDALLGSRISRTTYVKRTGVEERTATRDLRLLVEGGLLVPHGRTRGRYYTSGTELAEAGRRLRAERTPLQDPYPDLTVTLTQLAGG